MIKSIPRRGTTQDTMTNHEHSSPPPDNTDPEEVAKFERLSADWWDPHGSLRTLHVINPVRLAFIESKVPLSGKRVLDVGCGGGVLSESMAERGADVTGIDPGADNIRVAREHLTDCQVDYRACTLENFAGDSPARFDVITCMELLEHVPEPPILIEQMAALLQPGGHLFLATINRNLKSWLAAVVGAEYLLNLLPRGTHDYARFIRPPELAAWLRESGLAVSSVKGMQYLPGLNRAWLIDSPAVNYLVHARKID